MTLEDVGQVTGVIPSAAECAVTIHTNQVTL